MPYLSFSSIFELKLIFLVKSYLLLLMHILYNNPMLSNLIERKLSHEDYINEEKITNELLYSKLIYDAFQNY